MTRRLPIFVLVSLGVLAVAIGEVQAQPEPRHTDGDDCGQPFITVEADREAVCPGDVVQLTALTSDDVVGVQWFYNGEEVESRGNELGFEVTTVEEPVVFRAVARNNCASGDDSVTLPVRTDCGQAADRGGERCLPVVSEECGCVYSCAPGVPLGGGTYQVSHSFWDEPLTGRIDQWCVADECTEAFFVELVCDIICAPRPADPTCGFRDGDCVSGQDADRPTPTEGDPH
jgi:hypothetical protein